MAEANYKDYLDRKRLALHVRTIRRFRKLSRQELAEKAGYRDARKITEIENASSGTDQSRVKDLANALDVSLEQLKGYRKIEITEKGYAKLSESEKTALFLFAPILKVLPDEDIRYLLDTALIVCGNRGVSPEWAQTEFQKQRSARSDKQNEEK